MPIRRRAPGVHRPPSPSRLRGELLRNKANATLDFPLPMRISRKTHAVLDYFVALALLLSGALIAYPDNVMRMMAFTFGLIVAGNSAATDYGGGLLRFVPFPIHRGIDLLVGVALAFSPIPFAAHGIPAAVFVTCGALLILASFFTRSMGSPTGVDNPILPGAE